MNFRSSIVVFIIIGAVFLGAYYPQIDNEEKEGMIFHTLLSILDKVHFQPQDLNDEFSKKAFDTYLEYIDGPKRFLTQADIDEMKAYETLLDDQARNRNLDFFDLSVVKLEGGVLKAKAIYQEIIDSDFDLNKKEMIQLDEEKKDYAKDDDQLKEYWRKSLKYQVISKIDNLRDSQEKLKKKLEEGTQDDEEEKKILTESEIKAKAEEIVKESFDDTKDDAEEEKILSEAEIKAKAIEGVKELFDDWFERIDRVRRSDRFEMYLNTFTHLYDPHSDYFNPKEKQDFDINMGGKLEGIGARLQQDGDYTKVSSIVPGGPAWKGKDLEVDDRILQVTQEGKEAVDIFGWRIDDVVQIIRGKKGTVVFLNIEKKDGSTEKIRIERDEVIIDESFARSVIVDIPDAVDNIGYIKLPKFYSDFEKKDGNSCAEDIKIELEKLNEKNVNGIILDLRYNGGGSLTDVVKMSGLFIEKGPIVQVKPREGKAYVHNDNDASVQYDGPLIVMVNSYSASASEILAAALQDYDRAVIVGSNATFGKGTVQRFFDLDRAIRGNSDLKPLGQVKLTMQKFYRVNGGSTQLEGVVPDIILPDRFNFMDVGEKEYDHAMEWSEIEPVEYSQNVRHINNMDELIAKSAARVESNDQFNMIIENSKRIKKDREQTEYPLHLEEFTQLIEAREKESKLYKDIMKDSLENIQIANLAVDVDYINSDESRVARNEDWIKGLYKDIYLEETMMIMKDMIESGTSKANVDMKKIINKGKP